jgi:hypothetical protein
MVARKSFSLIEVSTAVVLLAIITSGMLGVFSQGAKVVRRSANRAIAYNLAQEKIEEKFRWVASDLNPPQGEAQGPVTGFEGFEREVTVVSYSDPPEVPVNTDLVVITATVWWDSGNRSISLQTLRYKL